MKRVLLFVFSLALSLVYFQCESDDVSYAFQEVSAPTDVSASFSISQDDTGTVSVTPSATGVTSFDIYYGDVENEEATSVEPGGTVTHVYSEGEYNVRIVAIGLTGLTSEFNQNINISFSAPEDLNFEVTQTALEVTVTPSATNATMFDVFFGENEDEEPVSILADEAATYTYGSAGTYDIRVVARGAGAATIESVQTVEISGASDPVLLPVTFDEASVNYALTTFNGTSFEVVENPDLSGANDTASRVGAITNSGNTFEGGTLSLGAPVDFSGNDKIITMKVYAEQQLPVLMKFEAGLDNARQTEVVVNHGGTGWELLTFDYENNAVKSYIDGNQGAGEPFVPTGQYEAITLFIDGPGTTAGTFYIDDIMQDSGEEEQLPQLPIDFESDMITYGLIGFGGPDFGEIPVQILENPDQSGANTSGTVAEISKVEGAQTYAGVNISLAGPIDFSSGSVVTIKVWSPRVGTPFLFKIEDTSSPLNNDGNPTVFAEVQTASTTAMQWEVLSFDLSTIGNFDPSISYDRMALFPDFGNTGAGEQFYFDDIQLASEGGDDDDDGDDNPDSTTPGEAAPTPVRAGSSVVSLFSEAYDNVMVDSWRTDWSSAMYEEVVIQDNNAKKYSQLDFVGIETLSSTVDASAMTHFHIDAWSSDYTSFSVKLVDLGPDNTIGTADDSEHQVDFEAPSQGSWTGFDIPLTDFEGLTGQANIGQIILVGRPVQANTVFIDNVYFYNE